MCDESRAAAVVEIISPARPRQLCAAPPCCHPDPSEDGGDGEPPTAVVRQPTVLWGAAH